MSVSLLQREIKTEVVIEASVENVWQTLTDFSSYGEWSEFILAVKGHLSEGEQLHVELGSGKKAQDKFSPVVIKLRPGSELRWRGDLISQLLFSGEHYFVLQEIDHNRTRMIHGEVFSGLLAPMVWKFVEPKVKLGFPSFNQSIKLRSENNQSH